MNGIRVHQSLYRVLEQPEATLSGVRLLEYCTPAKSINGDYIAGYVDEGTLNDDGTVAYLDLLALDGYTISSEAYGWYAYGVKEIDPWHVVDTTIHIWLDLVEPLVPYPHIMPQCSYPLP